MQVYYEISYYLPLGSHSIFFFNEQHEHCIKHESSFFRIVYTYIEKSPPLFLTDRKPDFLLFSFRENFKTIILSVGAFYQSTENEPFFNIILNLIINL